MLYLTPALPCVQVKRIWCISTRAPPAAALRPQVHRPLTLYAFPYTLYVRGPLLHAILYHLGCTRSLPHSAPAPRAIRPCHIRDISLSPISLNLALNGEIPA